MRHQHQSGRGRAQFTELKLKKFVILYPDDPYGKTSCGTYPELGRKEILASVAYPPDVGTGPMSESDGDRPPS
jgi:hypothetical protein